METTEMSCLSSADQMSENKVLAGLVPLSTARESVPVSFLTSGDLLAILSIPWLIDCLLHMVFSLHVYVYVQIFSFFKDSSHVGLKAHPTPL